MHRNTNINPFHATGLFLYFSKISENLWFSDVCRGYRKRPVALNELMLVLLLHYDRNCTIITTGR